MIINCNTRVQKPSANLSVDDMMQIESYVLGAVHSVCNCSPNSILSVRSLFGKENADWGDTPLQKLYEYHKSVKAADPASQAAKDLGWILKKILMNDKRKFELVGESTGKEYRKV